MWDLKKSQVTKPEMNFGIADFGILRFMKLIELKQIRNQ
jgi:hypothetical protein